MASACGGDEPAPSGSQGRTGRTVDVVDNEYVPVERTVSVGTEVIWTHKGSIDHTVTSSNDTFDSHPDCPGGPCMKSGETFRHTFTTAGRFTYACKVHGELMSGTIVVE